MADQVLGNLVWKITGDSTDFDKKRGKSEKALKKFGASASRIGKNLTRAVTLPLIGLGAATVKLASDVEESINAVNVVFEDASDTINDFGKTTSEAVGLSRSEFNELATVIGAQLKQSGQDIDDVADNTVNLTERAADLASVFNTSVKDAAGALGSALRGESEPARRFGINLSDAAVQAEALASGLVDTKDQINDQIKVQARYNLILEQSKDVAGDFANTSDSVANSTRILIAEVKDVGAELGKVLLPIVKDLVSGLRDAVKWFSDLDDSTKRTILTIAGIAAAAGPAIGAIGGISKALGFLAANPAVAVLAGLTAIAIAVVELDKKIKSNKVKELAEELASAAIELGVAEDQIEAFAAKAGKVVVSIGLLQAFGENRELSNSIALAAAEYELTEAQAIELLKTSKDLTDAEREHLGVLQQQAIKREEIAENLNRYDRLSREGAEQLIKNQENAFRISVDKAAAERQAADEIARQNRLLKEQVILTRLELYKAYSKQLVDINALSELGLLTEIELIGRKIEIEKDYIEGLVKTDLVREKDFNGHIDLLKQLKAQYAALTEAQSEQVITYSEGYALEMEKIKEAEREKNDALEEYNKERRDKEAADREEDIEKEREKAQQILMISQTLYTGISGVVGSYFEFKKASAEGDEEEQKRIAKQEFAINKALQIANVGINTASAIVGFLAKPGGLLGLGLSIAAGVTGGAKAALIAATPPPKFANGVENFVVPPGYPNDSFPIMVQSEEVVSVKTPEQQANGGSDQVVHQQFILNDQVIFDTVNYGLRSGKILIEGDSF